MIPAETTQLPMVLIVLLNWNSLEETRAALDSVARLNYGNYRVLVVDNGSHDGSNIELKKLAGERVEVLESPVNVGYTGGCNLGLKRALEMGAEYAWLLNNDAVTEPGTLSSLVALAESDQRIGLVTPRIAALDEERLTFAGGVVSVERRLYEETHNPEVAAAWAEEFPDAGLVIGTAMLVRMELVRKTGLLDESFFAYYEDVDYSVRSSKAGFRNVVDAGSVVKHYEKNRNTKRLEIRPHYWYYMARNESRFWRKHLGMMGSLRNTWSSANGFLRHRNRLESKPESQKAILAGLWHGWLNRGGAYKAGDGMPLLPAMVMKLYSRRSALRVPQRGGEVS